MTPQRPGFNRYSWAELENALRSYVYNHPGTQLYVVSGPVLHEDLPAISRSVNGVSIPESYFKIAVDLDRQRGIGFIMPNRQISAPIETFAKPIREIEAELGYDFGSNLPAEIQDKIETQTEVKIWLDLPESAEQRPFQHHSGKNTYGKKSGNHSLWYCSFYAKKQIGEHLDEPR